METITDRSLDAWVTSVHLSWGPRAAQQLTAALEHAGATSVRDLDPERLGRAIAARGCPLDEAHDWLAQVPPGRTGRVLRQRLHSPEALIRFTVGWAEATAQVHGEDQITTDMLRLTLHAHVRRAADRGVGPDVALVVISAAHPSAAATAAMFDAAAAVFAAGETIARCTNGNVVVLANRDDSLDGCIDHLVRAISIDPALDDAHVRVWVEPVGRSTAFLDALLIDLSA